MSILSTSSKLVRVGDSYSAGEGISIENNTISVTGDYGHAYYPGENISISDDNVISSKDWSSDIDTAVQNASAETTAWVDSQNYLTDASMSDYALVTEVETTSGLLKMDIDTVSGSISGKMDSTAFSDWQNGQYSSDIAGLTNNLDTVSGVVDAISGAVSSLDIPTHQEIINASGYAYSQSTAWTDSQGYLTQHQPISADEWNDSYETVLANSAQWSENTGDEDVNNAVYNNSAKWNEIEVYQTNSSTYLTAHQDISNKLDTTAFSTVSGTFLTAHQSLDGYLTKTSADTLYQPIGSYAYQTDLEQVSGDLKDDIDYISGVAITAHQDISNKLDTTAFSTVSGTFLTAVDLSNYYTKSETSGADELANAFANIPAGDADVNAYVQGNSATIDNVNSTVQTNSAQWAEGVSVDTIPVAVISPLVTGFSGESAYLGIESTALNLSSYVPVSSIGVNSQGYVSGISGKDISAHYSRNALTANYAYTADRAYHDRNNNEITSYYQPKLNISGNAGTITSINGSAVGASIPEGWELVAGQGIEIVDDAENNQTTISVTAAGGNPEVESYVTTNSGKIDSVCTTYQSNSANYLTAHQTIPSAKWEDASDCVQTNSANWVGGVSDTFYIYPGKTTNKEIAENSGKDLKLYNSANNVFLDFAGKSTLSNYTFFSFKEITGTQYNQNTLQHLRLRVYPNATSACKVYDTNTANLLDSNSTANQALTAYYDAGGNSLTETRSELDILNSFVQSNSANWEGGSAPAAEGVLFHFYNSYDPNYGSQSQNSFVSGAKEIYFKASAQQGMGIPSDIVLTRYGSEVGRAYWSQVSSDGSYNYFTASYINSDGGEIQIQNNGMDYNCSVSANGAKTNAFSQRSYDCSTDKAVKFNVQGYNFTGQIEGWLHGRYTPLTSFTGSLTDFTAKGYERYVTNISMEDSYNSFFYYLSAEFGAGGSTVASGDVFPPTNNLDPHSTYYLGWNANNGGLFWYQPGNGGN